MSLTVQKDLIVRQSQFLRKSHEEGGDIAYVGAVVRVTVVAAVVVSVLIPVVNGFFVVVHIGEPFPVCKLSSASYNSEQKSS